MQNLSKDRKENTNLVKGPWEKTANFDEGSRKKHVFRQRAAQEKQISSKRRDKILSFIKRSWKNCSGPFRKQRTYKELYLLLTMGIVF